MAGACLDKWRMVHRESARSVNSKQLKVKGSGHPKNAHSENLII